MKDIFKDIMNIEGVHGVIVLSGAGQVMLSQFSPPYADEQSRLGSIDWTNFIGELADIEEAEFVFDRRRLYTRKTGTNFFLVALDDLAPVSMVRLNCEILLPSLDRLKPGRKLGKLFKKRIF